MKSYGVVVSMSDVLFDSGYYGDGCVVRNGSSVLSWLL